MFIIKSGKITTPFNPFYADLDENTDLWCVFSVLDDIPHAYSSWCDRSLAEADALQRNEQLREEQLP